MSRIMACRACLSPDVYVCPTPRQYVDLFETLTNITMQSPDRKPLGLCRMCCHSLRKYHKFLERCLEADAKLNQLLLSYTQETPVINVSMLAPELKWTPIHTEQIPLPHPQGYVLETKVEVKQECGDSGDNYEQIPFADVARKSDNNSNIDDFSLSQAQKNNENDSIFPLKTVRIVLDRLNIVPRSQSQDELEQEVDDADSHWSVYSVKEECTMDYAERNGDQLSIDGNNEEDETGSVSYQLELDHEKIVTDLQSTSKITKLREKCSYDDACKLKIYSFYICDHCNKKFTSKVKLRHHIAEHLNTQYRNLRDQSYQCPVCEKGFSQNQHLERHLPIHTGDKPYQCPVCEKCFSQNQDLMQHLRIHTGEKRYQCPMCKKCFIRNDRFKQHLRIHIGDKPYQCPVCEKSFSLNHVLKRHLRIHTGDKPYQCPVCDKCFSRNMMLKQHLRIHTGDKPYQCPVCDKCFSQNQNLKQHLRIHTGDKPYQCPVCEKSFSLNNILKRHLRIHTGDKPYQCPVCEKSFSRNHILKRHLRIHTKEKPYQCPVCDKCFSLNQNLKLHLRIHTGDKPYQGQ